MAEVPLCSPQQHKGVSMNLKTFAFAHHMRASITHAFDAHMDHCGSKSVNHFNELLYPQGCLYRKTTHHMFMANANVPKLQRSTTHVHACSLCWLGHVRMHGLRSYCSTGWRCDGGTCASCAHACVACSACFWKSRASILMTVLH